MKLLNTSRPWNTEGEFLELFGVNCDEEGSQDFCTLCAVTALFLRFPECGKSYYDVVSKRLRELHWSPMVFYARIRKSIKPVIDAGKDTLAGLGVVVEAESVTVPALVKAIAPILAETIPECCRTNAEEAARYVEKPKKQQQS